MSQSEFRAKMRAQAPMVGTFMKTPSVDILEVLILSGLDFVCLDAEHAPFDRTSLNACAAVAKAADFPLLVRVTSGSPEAIGAALDVGATGVVVPHVTDRATAERVSKAARFGHGGRGYAGSTRWAGFATAGMEALLAKSAAETLVIAQIEDPEGVEACEEIAVTEGIDGLFLGPADLSVAYGKTNQSSPELMAAMERVGQAAAAAGLGYMTFVPNAEATKALERFGFHAWFVASEHAWILQGARKVMADLSS